VTLLPNEFAWTGAPPASAYGRLGQACDGARQRLAAAPQAAPSGTARQSEAAVSGIADWYKGVLEALPVPVYTVDTSGRLTFFNQAAAQLAGRTPRLGEDRWCVSWKLLRRDGTLLPEAEYPTAAAMRTGAAPDGVELIAARPDGRQVPLIAFPRLIHDEAGMPAGALATLVDITEKKQAEARLDYLNHHDQLTEMPNQTAFDRHLDAVLRERRTEFALVALDLDNFSRINDVFGRQVGDQALRRLGARLNRLPPHVGCFRLGGDTIFLVIAGHDGDAGVRAMLGELAAGWQTDLTAIRPTLQVTFSAGIAYRGQHGETAGELIASAKAALLRAKREQRGSIRFFDHDQDQLNRDRAVLNDELRAAIGTAQLSLHFQPLARQCGAITGFEALIRWDHPVHGRLSPDQFIPLAEESGLIIPLSAWILHAACAEAASWRDGLKISVNLSPVQFEHPGLVELVRTSLAETGLRAERLTLEITEGVLISNYVRAMGVLQEIASLGVAIALDDFGTGYSSLSYLHEFPLSEIKIDKSFATSLGLSRRSESIVRSVIELGHALGLRVVVEGVERHDQLGFIEQTNCDLVQGFLIGRPLNGIDSRKLIDDTGRGSPVPEDCPVI